MPRSVNSVAKRARRKKVMKQAKGYFGRRKNVWTVAKNAVDKAMQYSYRDRRAKKRTFRALWITRINAGAREHGSAYRGCGYPEYVFGSGCESGLRLYIGDLPPG